MDNTNKDELFDLGSEPTGEDFDPFASDDDNEAAAATDTEQADNTPESKQPEATAPTESAVVPGTDKKAEVKEPEAPGFADKPPVFEYAGATEIIDDASKTFDELRIEKSSDFPELEDGKRVSWTVEYGKITKTVADPKGMSVGKMKSDIETSKEFEDSLRKRGADKNPACKVKPRVTAQSKGTAVAYRGVFTNTEEAEAVGKAISIVPGRDGSVYEIRCNKMGKFVTPVYGCDLLSDVQAGFTPALPRVPMDLMMKIISFFRYYTRHGADREVLVNVYWDTVSQTYVLDAPEQTVTSVSVESSENPAYTDDRYIHYMDIHSHNSMKAFFSTTDNNDEKATRLYTVIGRLDKYFPDIKTRISNGGKFMEIDPIEVFEQVACPFPEEWTDVVRFRDPHSDRKETYTLSVNGADAL
jgi:PRTRC genetic system protein A